jgi:hypothetical protein
MTDPVALARSIGQLLLEYGPDTEFGARSDAVMVVAALPARADVGSGRAHSGTDRRAGSRTVTFAASTVDSSSWAIRHRGRRPNSSASGCRRALSRSTSTGPK